MPEPTTDKQLGRGELQTRVVRGVVWTAIHTIISLPLAFAVNILLARVLGVVDYGRLAYLTTVIGLAGGLAGLGVSTALVQFGAKAHASGRIQEVRRYLSGAQGFRLMVSGPVIALAVLLLVDVDAWLMILALVFGVLSPALFGTANECLTIENRSDRSAQLAIVRNVLLQVAVVSIVLTVGTPDAVWSARIIAGGVMFAIPVWIISRDYRSAVLRPRPPWTLPRSFWAFALPTFAAGIIGTLAVSRTQVIFLEWLSDPVALGMFSLAFGVAGHVYAPAQAFVGPLIPAISGLATVDAGALHQAFLRSTRAASAVGGVMLASALPALATLVPLIYGRGFAPAADLVMLLGLAGAVTLVGSPHQAFLMARLAGRRLLLVNIVSLVVNLALAVALIPWFGAWGATISCGAGMIVRALQLTIGEARAIGIAGRELVRSTAPMGVASIIAICLWLVVRQLDTKAVVAAMTCAVVGIILYVVAIKVGRIGLTIRDQADITRSLPTRVRVVGSPLLWLVRGSSS